jgi:hypothetical protein
MNMKNLTYTLLVIFLSANIYAVEIPNQFEDGQVTSASQMNENFQALKVEIEALKAQLEHSQTPPKVEFRGYSAPISGSSGIPELAAACDAVSIGSRICLDDELLETPYSESFVNPEEYAWIARKLSHANISTGSSRTVTENWYGGTRSCWSGSNPFALLSNGRISSASSCSENTFPVACCK